MVLWERDRESEGTDRGNQFCNLPAWLGWTTFPRIPFPWWSVSVGSQWNSCKKAGTPTVPYLWVHLLDAKSRQACHCVPFPGLSFSFSDTWARCVYLVRWALVSAEYSYPQGQRSQEPQRFGFVLRGSSKCLWIPGCSCGPHFTSVFPFCLHCSSSSIRGEDDNLTESA